MSRILPCAFALAVATVLLTTCSAGEPSARSRLESVKNAIETMGLVMKGAPRESVVKPGAPVAVPLDVTQGGCYLAVAILADDDDGLSLKVVLAGKTGPTGKAKAKEAAVRFCVPANGGASVVVSSERENRFILAVWADRKKEGAIPPEEGSEAGTCTSPLPLTLHGETKGVTRGKGSVHFGSCAPGFAAEQIYLLEVDARSRVELEMLADFDSILYIRKQCDDPESEIACNDDAGEPARSRITLTLDPGRYYVFADGLTGQEGSFRLTAAASPSLPLKEVCAASPFVEPGVTTRSSTAGRTDDFQATCAAGATSGDQPYRLVVPERSRVRISLAAPSHDPVVYIRRTCVDPSTEIACNDDFNGSKRLSQLHVVLDPDIYTIVADGHGAAMTGPFSLDVAMAPIPARPVEVAGCADIETVSLDGLVAGDSMKSPDRVKGSCVGKAGGADALYHFTVRQRTRLVAEWNDAEFDGALSLRPGCRADDTEVACGSDGFEALLDPGDYYLAVEGNGDEGFGRFEVKLRSTPLSELSSICAKARPIQPGVTAEGRLEGQDRFRASCGKGAKGPEAVYRFRVRRRSMVEADLSAGFDGVLYVRSTCMDRQSEALCNDDANEENQSVLRLPLDPGQYYLFVDSFSSDATGEYKLSLKVSEI